MLDGRGVRKLVALRGLLIPLAFSLGVVPNFALGDSAWPVRGKLIGKNDKKAEDISGIACDRLSGYPRTCLVIDDNGQHAQWVTIKSNEISVGETVRLIENSFSDNSLELDGEGIAHADGYYYVVGSHGHPRDKDKKFKSRKQANLLAARIAASSQVVRLQAHANAASLQRSSKLREAIDTIPALATFADQRLEKNGLTIEGIAVANGRLYVGFRGPVL